MDIDTLIREKIAPLFNAIASEERSENRMNKIGEACQRQGYGGGKVFVAGYRWDKRLIKIIEILEEEGAPLNQGCFTLRKLNNIVRTLKEN